MFTQVVLPKGKQERLSVLRMHGRVQPTKKENGGLGSSHTERLNQSWFLDSNVSPGVKISACSTKIPSILTAVLNRVLSAETLHPRKRQG